MRAAIIVDGKVDNIIEVEALDALEGVELIHAEGANIGDSWDGTKFTAAPVAPAPVVVPRQVSRRQARQALLLAGLLDKVETAIANIVDPTKRALAQIEWEDSQVFDRDRPVLVQLATALGMTDTQLDELFITAGGL